MMGYWTPCLWEDSHCVVQGSITWLIQCGETDDLSSIACVSSYDLFQSLLPLIPGIFLVQC